MAFDAVDKVLAAEKEADRIKRSADNSAKARISEAEKSAAEILLSSKAEAAAEVKASAAETSRLISKQKEASDKNIELQIKHLRSLSADTADKASDRIVSFILEKGIG